MSPRPFQQGCPLSPPVRHYIKGLTINHEQHKSSLYTDDVLLYLTDPKTMIPYLKNFISTYGYFSGYKIHVKVNRNIAQSTKLQSGFKLPKSGFKYLQISPNLKSLYAKNYKSLIQSVSKDLDRLSALPLSMLGRIESVRMNVLPRFLCLFQILLIEIPQNTLDKLDRLVLKFHMAEEKAKNKTSNITIIRRPLITWIQGSSYTRWLNIEKGRCVVPLDSLPFSEVPLKETKSEWLRNTLNIWKKIKT
uniref:Reverse transcriptase domain-containing protein n=1 Tax=Gouania willdenowi TaxID=441366 RepID=A0A8C5DGG3_GOUWI